MKRSFAATALFALVLMVALSPSRSTAQSAGDSVLTPQEIGDRLAGISENLNTLNGDVAILKWLKVSGYLQARYEYNDTSKSTDTLLKNVATPRNANNFYLRRGRIKFTFQPAQTSKYVIYFDASKNSVSLKEAYVELYKGLNRHNFALTAGQFNVPFGYEIEYSSSKRDFPERSLAENKLFPGERDRGVNFTYTAPKYLVLNAGVLQGNGIDGPWNTPLKTKDIVARAKAKLGMIDIGMSGYWGNTYLASVPAVAGSSSWYDANGNNAIDAGEVTTTAPKAAVAGSTWDKDRYGLDAQAYFDLIPAGATGIRAEFYQARDYNKDIKKVAHEQGWYLWLSQNIGRNFGAAARYDYWNPNTNGTDNATGTWSFAANYYYDGNVRITAGYDIPQLLKGKSTFSKSDKDRRDNRFTLQFQYTI
jgi:phosphate-selective porin